MSTQDNSVANEAARLEAENRELRADKERLDWLESVGFATLATGNSAVHRWPHDSNLRFSGGRYFWTATRISSDFTNCRDAIDAARGAK